MADNQRWRYGDTKSVIAPVGLDTVVEIGDLVYLFGDRAIPAVECSGRRRFHDLFLGVAMNRSRRGEVEPIRVATTGAFEFTCAPQRFGLGQLIGAVCDQDGSLANQVVIGLPGNECVLAIGRAERNYEEPTPRVLVGIVSTVMRGGVQRTNS